MANVETFAREVKKLKKKVGANREVQFHCCECGQPLKSYEHGELIRQRNVEESDEIRAILKQTLDHLSISMQGMAEG